jgi:hypothetical protein
MKLHLGFALLTTFLALGITSFVARGLIFFLARADHFPGFSNLYGRTYYLITLILHIS